MKMGTLAFLRKEEEREYDWYHLFCKAPTKNDVVVIMEEADLFSAGTIIRFVSLITGEEDWMNKEDFLDCFTIDGGVDE